VIESFPVSSDGHCLGVRDFKRFSNSFAEVLKNQLPTAQTVTLVDPLDLQGGGWQKGQIGSVFEVLRRRERMFAVVESRLLIPFFSLEGAMVLAVVEGADPLFLDKLSEDWLEDVKVSAEREFLLLKEARTDGLTGLLNLWNLQSLVSGEHAKGILHLVLIELLPKRTSCRFAIRYNQRCANLLATILQGDTLLHYIGNSIFALVLPEHPHWQSLHVERSLLASLKREGCHRVHIGSSVLSDHRDSEEGATSGHMFLDQAWTALRHAEKRGPFSFCAYSRLAHPENHPLQPPEEKVARKVAAWTKNSATFAVVLFRRYSSVKVQWTLLLPELVEHKWMVADGDLVVFLTGFDGNHARSWAEGKIRELRKNDHGDGVQAGICAYPCGDFSKAEVLFNCRKALYHATFLDEMKAVVFDSISLNLSGDVYYGDGDLARAVSEYTRGLLLDDTNINLHNSLGVTLATMNKFVEASACFEKALQIDGNNFMALYNLGLAEQARGRLEPACVYLDEALRHFDGEEAGSEVLEELRLQVGMLAGELGSHQHAIEHLLAWRKIHGQAIHGGKACYFLGRSYAETGNLRLAMEELQRALQFNEFDDRAMSLLGTVYLRAGEGDEIALTLCRKSVELEPANRAYRLRLADALIQCGLHEEARDILRRLLANKQWRGLAQALLGRSALRLGELKQAKRWLSKALEQQNLGQEYRAEVEKGMARLA
jgi:tetratricopeptide (TPR) repeat protein